MSKLTERILFLKFVRILKFVNFRNFKIHKIRILNYGFAYEVSNYALRDIG